MKAPPDDSSVDAAALEDWLVCSTEPVLLVDAGGVLFNNVVEESSFISVLAATFGAGATELRAMYSANDERFETNRVDVCQVIAECVERLGGRRFRHSEIAFVETSYAAAVEPSPLAFALLDAARSAGRVLVLANNEAERWDRVKHERFAHLDRFDVIGSSWALGACKPTPAYFERLEGLLAGHPRSSWRLLDDNPDVVTAAREYGVAATLYCGLGRVDRAGASTGSASV